MPLPSVDKYRNTVYHSRNLNNQNQEFNYTHVQQQTYDSGVIS